MTNVYLYYFAVSCIKHCKISFLVNILLSLVRNIQYEFRPVLYYIAWNWHKPAQRKRKKRINKLEGQFIIHKLKKFRHAWLEIEQILSATITNSSIKTEQDLTISAYRVGNVPLQLLLCQQYLPWSFTSWQIRLNCSGLLFEFNFLFSAIMINSTCSRNTKVLMWQNEPW